MRRQPDHFLRDFGVALVIAMLLPVSGLPVHASDAINRAALLHDSRSDLYRTPLGPVPIQSTVTLRFRTAAGDADAVTMRVWSVAEQKQTLLPMAVANTTPDGYAFWETTLDVGQQVTIYWYRFIISKGGETLYYEDDTRLDGKGSYLTANEGGPGTVYEESPDLSWQLTVYDPQYYTPEWMRNAVVYQIFPDRFRDGDPSNDPPDGSVAYYDGQPVILHTTWNEPPVDPRQPGPYQNRWGVDFFGGDLDGITEELDYLKDLGVTAIYLNPIFEARSNHRYDTADYKRIDPILGDIDSFRRLVSEAQKRGIVLILDGVFNHMSSDGPFFDRYHRYEEVGACESLNSEYRNWFLFIPPKGEQPSPCVDNPQSSTYYTSWAGFDSIPKINNDNNGPRLYFYLGRNSVVATWGREGIGGWRLDVGGDIDPGAFASDYWENFRVAVRNANPEGVIIGEEWGNATAWLLGKEWDSVMNYRLRTGILGFVRRTDYTDNDASGDNVIRALTPSQVDGLIRSIEAEYPPMAYHALLNVLDSHDTSRLLFVAGDKPRQKLAALFQFTLPGAPTIYYGDEIALNAPSQPDSGGVVQDDPYNRAPYPWPDASGDAYGPPDEEMLAFYKQLSALRHANPALREGRMITLLADDATGVYAFLRISEADANAALVVLNNSESDQTVDLSFTGLVPNDLTLEPAFGGSPISTASGAATVTVPALSGNVWTATRYALFTAPQPPANLSAQGQNGSVNLTWDAILGVGIMVYRSPVATGGYEPVTAAPLADVSSYTDTSVTNGYRYTYAVAAVSADGLIGPLSAGIAAIPSASVAQSYYLMGDAPQSATLAYGLAATVKAAILVQGETEAEGAAAGVLAEAALVPQGTEPEAATWVPMQYIGEDQGADVYSATIPVLAAGDFVQVARFSANAGETWTVVTNPDGTWPPLAVAAPADTRPPASPASVSILQASLSGVVVVWEPSPSDDVAAYRVYRTSGNTTSQIAEVPASAEGRYLNKAVAQGDRYSYAVSAVDTSLNESERISTETVTVERRRIPVTFTVTVPDYTKQGKGDVYIAGDFGVQDLPRWDPAGLVMTKIDDQHWTITLELPEGTAIQYKYVRGTWDAVEKGVECEEIANRTLTVQVPEGQTGMTVDGDVVAKWRDLDKCG
jgi:glycosidase